MVVGELAHEKELVIIGGGPGGYHAAIRAAQLGSRVTLIERENLGGVCLNKGCIPSKVFAHGAERLASAMDNEQWGIRAENLRFDLSRLIQRKEETVGRLRMGVEALCRANKIEIVKGNAFFISPDKLGVESENSYEVFRFKHAIIAAGGRPEAPSFIPAAASPRIYDPWTIADLGKLPEKLIVFGSDYIALEMAMNFRIFGSEVCLILDEGKSDFPFDSSINRELRRILKKKGIAVEAECVAEHAQISEIGVALHLSGKKGIKVVEGSHLFFTSVIRPELEELGAVRIGLAVTPDGYLKVDSTGRTSHPGIFAVGDITPGVKLAAKAIKQGKTAAETIAGRNSENDFRFLPYTARIRPPAVKAGLTEREARDQGYDTGTGEFAFSASGYAELTGRKEGIAKLVFDRKSDILLGVHMIGEGAIELASAGIQALEMAARDEDLIFPAYPHPALGEALLEAAEAFKGESIHTMPRKSKITAE
ncbi:dihydrolipoyl dehydrogenase family protein [Peribacillus sp. SCS-37]|uniref:dihydrolipoyl dehydrogenase family protein n=1 Tax=Paraperibacillus esterisolvens TaxID=3115296 RepID=UPI003906D3B8